MANGYKFINDGLARQVMFFDGEGYCAGILIGKTIICGCCGAIFELEDVLESAKEEGVVPIKLFDSWVDISDEIRGDVNADDEELISLEF